jgi:peptidoglycan/LPS O-acetylase OafA/YrhL
MFFYVIFGLSLIIRPSAPAIPATLIIGALVVIGTVFHISTEPLKFWTNAVMLEFLMGIWIFNAWRRGLQLQVSLRSAWIIAATMFGIMLWAHFKDLYWIRDIFLGIPAVVIVCLALSTESKVAIPTTVLAIGDASYSLYLLHPYIVIPVQKLIERATSSTIVMIVAVPFIVGLSIVFALVSYRIVERPANNWLRAKFIRARRVAPIA